MRVPQLHIGAVGGIADIERIKQQHAAVITINHMLGQPVPSVFSHRLQIGQGKARRRPFRKGQLGWADFNTVGIIWGIVAQGRTARWVDFTVFAEMFVHGDILRFFQVSQEQHRNPVQNRHQP